MLAPAIFAPIVAVAMARSGNTGVVLTTNDDGRLLDLGLHRYLFGCGTRSRVRQIHAGHSDGAWPPWKKEVAP